MTRESQLEEAFRTRRFTEPTKGTGDACTTETLLKHLFVLQRSDLSPQDSLEQAIIANRKIILQQYDANVLYFCDQLFQLAQLKAEIDPSLMEKFMVLRPVVAAVILHNSLGALLTHPLCQLLDHLWYASLYWTPLLGKTGEKYKERIESVLQKIRSTNPARAPYSQWLTETTVQMDKEFHRADLLATRVSQAERDSWVRKQSRQIVQHNINRILLYADMPDVIENLLKGPWRDSLHQVLLSHGIDSHEWHNLLRLAEYLLDSVQTPANEKEKKSLYKLIPKIPAMLAKQLTCLGTQEALQEWISAIEALHMKVLMGDSIAVHPAEPLPITSDEAAINTSVSSALIKQIDHIHEGQWLVYHDENNDPLLCRLSVKLEDAGQLLFVNVLGAKCLQKSFADFAYLLAARHIHLLNTENNFSQSIHDTLNQFVLMHRFHTLLQADESERRKRETTRMRSEVERRKRAEEKALLEAERLALAKKEEVKRAKMKTLEDKLIRAKEANLRALDELAVGAWVEITINGNLQKCKVAAILNANTKLILTNREGIKVTELLRETLTQQVLDGTASIIETGHRFESALEQMIKTLRKP